MKRVVELIILIPLEVKFINILHIYVSTSSSKAINIICCYIYLYFTSFLFAIAVGYIVFGMQLHATAWGPGPDTAGSATVCTAMASFVQVSRWLYMQLTSKSSKNNRNFLFLYGRGGGRL